MKNRYRIEIFDEIRSNDLTIYSETAVDKDYLIDIVFSNLRNFQGNVSAYVFDNKIKKKTTFLSLPFETINKINSKAIDAAELMGLKS
ncbi:hypothetical protein EB001_09445 [bacterium]|nr:hypothetical protein [bacterium]